MASTPEACHLSALKCESAALAAQAIAGDIPSEASVLLIGDIDSIYADALKPICASLAIASSPSQVLDAPSGPYAYITANGASPGSANGATASRTFDVVVCTEHAARDVLLAGIPCSQLARLLNKDGYVAIAALNVNGLPARLSQFTTRPPHTSLLQVSDSLLRALLEEGGYDIGTIEGVEMEWESLGEYAAEILGSAKLAETLMKDTSSSTAMFIAIAFAESLLNSASARYTTMCLDRANRSLASEVRHLSHRQGDFERSLEQLATVAPQLAELKSELHQMQCNPVFEDSEMLRAIDGKLRDTSRVLRAVDTDPSPSLPCDYRQMMYRLRGVIAALIPEASSLLVVSKGDESMLESGPRSARHFPATAEGVYAGHHPADSAAAILQLKDGVAGGAEYLVIPDVYRWWLDHYLEFSDYLEASALKITDESGCGVIYKLNWQED